MLTGAVPIICGHIVGRTVGPGIRYTAVGNCSISNTLMPGNIQQAILRNICALSLFYMNEYIRKPMANPVI